ncbi:TRAP transporter small permease [Fredinandcohnia onubensis]|uniref:TRAP transporter small permease n=1 Tax=Fredinandcohnia onubensis TaxID=1571209 RepID=UPI000C0BC59D|nr:TRAP transporter small permease [Fredinandcohnia onubensis]
MKLIKSILDKILSVICIILFAAMVVLVTWQVITRFIFNDPSAFSEELAKYCFVWLGLFGAAFLFGENGHMAMDFIKDKFPRPLRLGVELFIQLVIIAFAAIVLVKGGGNAAELAWNQVNPSLKLPMGYLYLGIPMSGAFIIFYAINCIYLILAKKQTLEEQQQ